ncbi:hypothetical protein RSOLAG1IB_05709 [Rhizoctonia solani AG-1 IB]|uniref:Uncharacterized protein n=1 Tax=Thanatephorus cucumeris (strain AG1-IB / isolate 7/3/14) TaxID=1108050 RepID=A0A0B7F4N6_THACB|nr:hypothetical protein RSOLAG1IB_05709 [Rhizoctonia solani AG-1 IB]
MGRPTVCTASLLPKSNGWQQPNEDMALEASGARGLPTYNAEQESTAIALTATNLVNTRSLPPVSIDTHDGRITKAEEEADYDMCTLCTEIQDDDYILVDPEVLPDLQQAPSENLPVEKGRKTSQL